MGLTQEQRKFEREMMKKFPAGTRVVVYPGSTGVVTTHTADMQGRVTGVMVRFDSGDASEQVSYDKIEKI